MENKFQEDVEADPKKLSELATSEDDFLSGSKACSVIDPDCEACQ